MPLQDKLPNQKASSFTTDPTAGKATKPNPEDFMHPPSTTAGGEGYVDLNLETDPFEKASEVLYRHSTDIANLIAYIEKNEKIIDMQAERMDKQETMLGSLTMAYVEMFAAVDILVKTVVEGFPTVEEQEKFLKTFAEFRTNVLKSIQEASRSGTEGLDPDTQRAMGDVAQRRQDNNDGE